MQGSCWSIQGFGRLCKGGCGQSNIYCYSNENVTLDFNGLLEMPGF